MSVRLLPVLEARLPKGARVLDVGCGDGALVKCLNVRGYKATGFDLYPPKCEELRFFKCDVNKVPFPFKSGAFDAVVVSCSFRFVREENTAKVVYELGRVTKKGGLILIYDTERLIADRIMSFLPWRYDFWASYGNTWRQCFRSWKYSLMVIRRE